MYTHSTTLLRGKDGRTSTIHRIKFLLIILLCFSFNSVLSQPGPEVQDANVSFVTDSTGTTNNTFYVLLEDTLTISKIKVKIGSELGLGDVFTKTFSYDVSTGLPSGMLYYRQGYKIYLSMGPLPKLDNFYGEVVLKSFTGTWGPSYQFISN